ncbi:hypothetical protein HK104_005081 [Borealophlyctis nickersoniae]|nr:hypothetical protein HK104_005081 [Borealophlyctis nickersoniae]
MDLASREETTEKQTIKHTAVDSSTGDETTEKQTVKDTAVDSSTGDEEAETKSTNNDRLVMGHESEGEGPANGTGSEGIDTGEEKESREKENPMGTATDVDHVGKVNGDGNTHAPQICTEPGGTTQTMEKFEAKDEAEGQAGALKAQDGTGEGSVGDQEGISDSHQRQQTPIVPAPIEVRKLVFSFIRSQFYYILLLLTFRALGQAGGNIQEDWFQRYRASRRCEKDVAQDRLEKGNGGVQEGISGSQERHPGKIVSAPIEVRQHIFSFIRSRFDYIRLLSTCLALKQAGGSIRGDWFRRYCANRWYENDGETPRDSKSPVHRVSAASAKDLNWNFRDMEVIETLCKFDENLDAVETLEFKEAAEKLFTQEYRMARSFHGVPVSYIQTFSRVCGEPGGSVFSLRHTTRDPFVVSKTINNYSLNVYVKSPMNLFDVGDHIPVIVQFFDSSEGKTLKRLYLRAMDAIGNILFGAVIWKVTLPNGRVVYDDGTLRSIFSDFKSVEGDGRIVLKNCVPKHDFHAPPTPGRSHIPRAHLYLKDDDPILEVLGGQVLPFTLHTVMWNVYLEAK